MPKLLRERCQPDSIFEFQSAARCRFEDGLSLAVSGRRTAAIYLWGYCAEMTLKAAFFSKVKGYAGTQTITLSDLDDAVRTGKQMGVPWPKRGRLHNVRAWAELLVTARAATPNLVYPNTQFGFGVLRRGQQLDRIWCEILRYHRNVAYPREVKNVREATEWLLANSHFL